MNTIIELFQYTFFQNAFFAAGLAAISCGIIGTYIVSKRMVFITGGITHASFGGIGIAYYLGLNPIFGAAIFALLTALGIENLTKRAEIRNDSAIAILWSLGMAIGIIFVYLTPGYAPNLMSYLFGSILTVNHADLIYLSLLSMAIILFFTFFYRFILFIAFDEQFALTRKAPVNFINYFMISLISLTIVLNIKIAGIIMVLSLLTIPQNAANLFTKEFRKIIYLSILIGFSGSIIGLLISYWLDIPSGATIIFSLAGLYLILRFIRAAFGNKYLDGISSSRNKLNTTEIR
jgi:zinc transport system permease protein